MERIATTATTTEIGWEVAAYTGSILNVSSMIPQVVASFTNSFEVVAKTSKSWIVLRLASCVVLLAYTVHLKKTPLIACLSMLILLSTVVLVRLLVVDAMLHTSPLTI